VTLLRRVSFDLTGLPPTPEEVDAFLADRRAGAYERVVDRLLASPHHGERWAQHWLDVARFAETNGYEADGERPQAWRYRDYVVRAFNRDKPYNTFVTEQVAGDLLARAARGSERAEWLIAVGFHRCGPIHLTSGNLDPEVGRQEVLTEMLTGLGAAFLGLTLHCARCHDHKFDPISLRDYYRLQAFFSAARYREVDLASPARHAAHARQVTALQLKTAPLRARLTALDAPYHKRLRAAKLAKLEPAYRAALAVPAKKRTPKQRRLAEQAEVLLKVTWDEVVAALTPADRVRRTALRRRLHQWLARQPAPPARAWSLAEGSGPLTAHVLRRGDVQRKGARVSPAFPRALGGSTSTPPPDRLALARWLTRDDHPLTARVIVNRLWQHHFGRGLVRTPNDFGLRGDAPSHPELLDWLARELIEHGWSLKHLHRLMVTSATYQQASRPVDARARQIDPDNRLLSRANRRRLEGEGLRDNVLAVSGNLLRHLGGAPVRVPLEPEVYELIFTEGEPDGLWPVTPDRREHGRRSLYLLHKRNVRLPLLEAFDQPDTLTSCPVRPVSIFAPQALILLNGAFVQGQARALAWRLFREAGTRPDRQIERAYRLALGRLPRAWERRLALEFLESQTDFLRDRMRGRLTVGIPAGFPAEVSPARAAALADFCLALLNCNAFVHVE
jgi:hypothetical protein